MRFACPLFAGKGALPSSLAADAAALVAVSWGGRLASDTRTLQGCADGGGARRVKDVFCCSLFRLRLGLAIVLSEVFSLGSARAPVLSRILVWCAAAMSLLARVPALLLQSVHLRRLIWKETRCLEDSRTCSLAYAAGVRATEKQGRVERASCWLCCSARAHTKAYQRHVPRTG